VRKTLLLLVFVPLLTGCDPNVDIPETKCLVFTTMNHHSVTTWVNDEPVLVCGGMYDRYNMAFWQVLRKGVNEVHFTAQRLPAEVTDATAEHDPADGSDGSTTVKIIKGTVREHEDIIVWNVTADSQTSPRWTIHSDAGRRPSLESFDPIVSVDDETKADIRILLGRFRAALDSKNLSAVGWREADLEAGFSEAGLELSMEKDIYGAKPYTSYVLSLDELEIVHGAKTIMVYHPHDELAFFAGRCPDAPNELGVFYHYISGSSLFFVKNKGKLEPLWTKKY